MTAPDEPVGEPAPTDRRLRVIAGTAEDGEKVLALLDDSTIRVDLSSGTVPWRQQILALALVDLLGRLFPRLDIRSDAETPSHPDLPPGPERFQDRLAEAARNGGLPELGPTAPVITIRVGTTPPHEAPGEGVSLHVDGGGWVSYNGTQPSQLPDGPWAAVSIGPLAAACRAAGQTASLILGSQPTTESIPPAVYVSALTYSSSDAPLPDEAAATGAAPLLHAVLVGAGSIGGATAYALAHTPGLAGTLVVADPQRLEEKNLDRALLATATVAAAEPFKADVVKAALAHHGALEVTAWPKRLEEWVASRPRTEVLPLVLTAVDSRDARRLIQDCLPLDLVNAACNPTEIHLSGHRTGQGPCVCCLHMEEVLDAKAVRSRLLQAATGLNERMVLHYLAGDLPMPAMLVRGIERHRGLAPNSLSQYEGRTLEELRVGHLLYGATPVQTSTGTVAVAAPYVTALAGTLLAGEALKVATPGLDTFRLGPPGPHIKYAENPLAGANRAVLTNPPRWPGSECLCRSTRRLRIMRQRYGLAPEPADDQNP